jgi:hypothetical protein
MADLESTPIPQRQKSRKAPIIAIILALIVLIWLVMMSFSKEFFDEVNMGYTMDQWILFSTAILIVLIIIILPGMSAKSPVPTSSQGQFTSLSSTPAAEPAQGVVISEVPAVAEVQGSAVMDEEPLVVEAEIVEVEAIEVEPEEDTRSSLKAQKPKLVEYPKKVPGGVYGDTIVRVDPITKLNLRTLLVRSCMICDRQGKCWDEFMDTVPRDEFLDNLECKKGLRHIRGGDTEEPRKMLKKKTKKRSTTA